MVFCFDTNSFGWGRVQNLASSKRTTDNILNIISLPCAIVQQQSQSLIYKRVSNGRRQSFLGFTNGAAMAELEQGGRCVGWIPLSDDRVMLLSPAQQSRNYHGINCTTSNLIKGDFSSSTKISHGKCDV